MIQINLVSRIDTDKNAFLDLVYAGYKLKESGITGFQILFIGAVYNTGIYQNILQMAKLLGISPHISFTLKSIPINQLSPEIKNGYFVIQSVGDFIGYAGIESIDMGLKTIYYNADEHFNGYCADQINICRDIDGVISLIKLIDKEKETVDGQITAANLEVKKAFYLDASEKHHLLSILLPGTTE